MRKTLSSNAEACTQNNKVHRHVLLCWKALPEKQRCTGLLKIHLVASCTAPIKTAMQHGQ
jgi:hypothetical protein